MRLNKKGFSLIELMVVIAIIGILATAGINMYGTYQAKARDTKRVSNLNQLTIGLQWYYTDKSEYPEPRVANCLSDTNGLVHNSLKSYYDNKNIPLDPQKNRRAWACEQWWAPYYKQLSKDSVANTAYILWSNVEVKSSANFLYSTNNTNNYTKANEALNKLTDAQRNDKTENGIKNILYAIVNN